MGLFSKIIFCYNTKHDTWNVRKCKMHCLFYHNSLAKSYSQHRLHVIHCASYVNTGIKLCNIKLQREDTRIWPWMFLLCFSFKQSSGVSDVVSDPVSRAKNLVQVSSTTEFCKVGIKCRIYRQIKISRYVCLNPYLLWSVLS